MPASSLLALIDDIASILDDVAVLTKVATKKTAGVLGDDLALNAQQVTGVSADRELPVVWAVAKGSVINKAILVPSALAISAVAPWAVTPLLMFGGAFLCFEGVEKLAHKYLHPPAEEKAHHDAHLAAVANPAVDILAVEKEKIKGAIRTDFILSAEIVVIALGTVATQPFGTRVSVLLAIAAIMTVGVYGLVAGIVKLDDFGQYLMKEGASPARRAFGAGILKAAPVLMKTLSVAGTVAMFLVGGGIVIHGVPFLHHAQESVTAAAGAVPGAGGVLGVLASSAFTLVAGVAIGAVILAVVSLAKKLVGAKAAAAG